MKPIIAMNANDLNKPAETGVDLNSGTEPENSYDAPVNETETEPVEKKEVEPEKEIKTTDTPLEEKKDEPADQAENITPATENENAGTKEEKADEQKEPEISVITDTKEEAENNPTETDADTKAEPVSPGKETSGEKTETDKVTEEKPAREEPVASTDTPVKEDEGPVEVKNASEDEQETHETEIKKISHIQLSKEQLIERLNQVLHNYPPHQIKEEIEAIKSAFYKKRNAEIEDLKKKFIDSGEKEENFSPPVDPLETKLKELLLEYKTKRAEYNRRLEEEKEHNYQAKLEVIKEINVLINSQESLNETFHDFRKLQHRWHEIGIVPQNKVRDLWETYNYTIEKFYNYIKINKELRDLDLKKNLEKKIELCEKAEALLLESTIVKAFQTLQKLHDQWREIGPVPMDKKDEIWARFKEATTKINKRHQEYFEGLKEQLKKNLEAKTELCERAEALTLLDLHTPKEWEEKSKELIEIQQIWKTIGFAPKKDNNHIYERFRVACDNFFNRKREFFKNFKKNQQNNLQQKTELCLQAEAMKDSTDWKHTTEEFIRIQKKWKQIGPVPRKYSDIIWKRFRTACDAFFENKANFFQHIDSEHEKNLELKEKLLEEVKQFEPGEDVEESFRKLQEFQKRWNEIGHVPIADKNRVNQEFRKYINKHFDSLNLDEFSKNIQRFRNKLENIRNSPNYMDKLIFERNKIISRLKQLENDITTWENNIGFFAKSKKSEALVRDFQHKIDNGKQNIKLFNKKLDLIDSMMN